MNKYSQVADLECIRRQMTKSRMANHDRLVWKAYLEELIVFLVESNVWHVCLKNYTQVVFQRKLITGWILAKPDFVQTYLNALDEDTIQMLSSRYRTDGTMEDLAHIIEQLVYVRQSRMKQDASLDESVHRANANIFDQCLPEELAMLYRGLELEVGHVVEQCPDLLLQIILFE